MLLISGNTGTAPRSTRRIPRRLAKTGDIGYLDDEGFLFLADRAKDMIIRGGENIYPIEIENELLELRAVKEVAAIGLPHERLGEEVAWWFACIGASPWRSRQ